ncbi:filamentous hemagglutinin N-terminal domain-containing protein [Pantanalinema rosaneae CENA516]|uniref:two-partner secretion domain-containing protein n=1 Tax=Pantanalinema rosaneae TaxID=1620701 RepID=UPI003D6E167A
MKPITWSAVGLLLGTTTILGTTASPGQSQITPTPNDAGTVVTPASSNPNHFNIGGGTQAGGNLFHSFQQFGLSQGQIATFLSNPSIQNILGRVTGGSASVIDGQIRVTGSTANLYLMNPAGIIFGNHASLNVPGSFTATTATAIGFRPGIGGEQWFQATGTNHYATLLGTPSTLVFSSSQPGAIVNAGNLAVTQGKNLTLLGGTVVNTGSLSAPGGSVTVAAIPGQKLVRVSQVGSILSLDLPTNTAIAVNSLPYTPLSLPQLLTGGTLTNATGIIANPDGTIRLTGSGVTIAPTAGTAIAGGTLTASSLNQTGGTVSVLGDRVALVNATVTAIGTQGGTVLIGGDFRGQGTIPNAQETYVSPNSVINVNALQTGNGGRAIVWADGTTRFYGSITAQGGAQAGNGGFVEVSGKQNLVYQGSVNTAAPNGTTGTLLLDPTNIVIRSGTDDGNDNGGSTIAFGNDAFGQNGQVLASDPIPTILYESELEGMANVNHLILEATNNITIESLADNVLDIPPIPPLSASGSDYGSITFRADADGNGVGNFTMDANDTLRVLGGRRLTISGANVALGNLETEHSVTVNATGSVTAGNIQAGSLTVTGSGNLQLGTILTEQSSAPWLATGNVSLTSTTGNVVVDSIRVLQGSPLSSTDMAVDIRANGIFQARNTFLIGSSYNGLEDAPASIVTPGSVSIQHGGASFTAGLGVERDAAGNVVFRTSNGTRAGEQVFIRPTAANSSAMLFEFADGTVVADTDNVTVRSVPYDLTTISPDASYTVGAIFIGAGTDAILYGSFGDSRLSNSSNIQVSTIPRPSLPIANTPTSPTNPVTAANPGNSPGNNASSSTPNSSTSPTIATTSTIANPDTQAIQRPITNQASIDGCSPGTMLVALNRGQNRNRAETTERSSAPTATDPCRQVSNDGQILQVLEADTP